MPAIRVLPFALTALLLAACGGGGGGGSAPPPAGGRCSGGAAAFTFGDGAGVTGKTAGAVLGSCSAGLADIGWTQTGGPTVALLSAQTPAISFDAPAAGSYTFRVSYRVGSGAAQASDVTVTVATPAAPPASTITVRADQAVRKGGNASLRAWPTIAAGDSRLSITWTQVEGPAVTLDTSDPLRAIFTAPEVAADTLLRFRATLQTAGGVTDFDEAMVLVENAAQAPANRFDAFVWSDAHVSRVHAYKRASPFAGALARCVYDAGLQYDGAGRNLCPLTTLPFLHQTTGGGVPTTAQIMERVLVSHDWMGAAFEDFLNSAGANDDLKRLFNGVTAIVIGAHVRPSFYFALTGAIYLDADNFWRTAAERDLIDETPDFRADFDRDLQYTGLWRYTEKSNNIFQFFPATSRLSRDTGYLRNELTWLLYHELAHASDFMPPAARGALDTGVSAWDNIAPRFTGRQLVSDTLAAGFPLQSAEMRALARVKFVDGPAASDATLVNSIPYGTLKSYTPAAAATFFAAEGANDEYNYHPSTREDVAMLFEEFMQSRMGPTPLLRDVGFTDKATASSTGSTLTVRWGQRGRVGDALVRPRVQQVVAALAPWVLQADANAVANLPAPLQMRAGESWTANLCLPGPCASPLVAAQRVLPLAVDAERALLARAMRQPPARVTLPGADGHRTPQQRLLRRLRAA